MTLQVTTLPARLNMPGKAGPGGPVGKHRAASTHRLQLCQRCSSVQPATGVSHGDKKLGKSSHCQLFFTVLITAKVMSSEKRVVCRWRPCVALGSSSGRSHAGLGMAFGLRGLYCPSGRPAPRERHPLSRHSGYRSHRGTGLGKMPKPGAF